VARLWRRLPAECPCDLDEVGGEGGHRKDDEEIQAALRLLIGFGVVRVRHVAGSGTRVVRGPASLEARIDPGAVRRRIRAEGFLPGKIPVSAAHLMGGCAMGRGPDDSVTDDRGRVHGLPWLRVADASLFPDSVEINPYLTIMALADRVAEGIRSEAGELSEARP
jgi:choline dehydrogenase-like flavoprotein